MEIKIKIIENEGFFGGAINDGISMPYKIDTSFSRDLRVWHGGNQASSVLISNKGKYIYSQYPFDIKVGNGELIVSSEHEIISKINGSSLKEAYAGLMNDFFLNDHKTPDLFMFERPQYNTWITMEWYCSEAKVLKYAREILSHGYPTGVLMIDDCWCKDYGIWEFDKERFSNPKKMIAKLHDLGFKVMVWCCPFISPDCDIFRDLEKKGLLVKTKNNETAITKWWNGYSAILDLANPEARKYFDNICQDLMDEYGVDGFKMDAGDPEYYSKDFVFADNKELSFQAQYWAQMGEKYSFNELRVAFNNNLKGVAHRLRDKNHSWDNEGLNMLIPNALAMGLEGYPYLCPDMIGGGMVPDFHREGFAFDQELFVRYAQVSALFPMMQFSLLPWKVLTKENQSICYEAVKLHYQYANEICLLASNASITGEPILRSLNYVFNKDSYLDIKDEFMLGDNILVAPMVTKGNNRSVIIPHGTWIDDLGQTYQEGTYDIKVPLNRLPIFKKVK